MTQQIKIALVLIILIGLPLFAYYFLQSGTRMRKEAMEALKPKIAISHFQNTDWKDRTISEDSLKGSKWLVAVLGADSMNRDHVQKLIKLNQQSSEEFTQKTYLIAGMNSGETADYLNALLSVPIHDPKWIISYMAADHVFPFSASVFGIPEEYKNTSVAIFLDDKQQIRNYYKLSDSEDVKKLVRHLPVFLSLKK
ncbi:MAG: BRCT domain-containing protein [Saprospiraceae bacterium]|nr:BRCT domain-containing protein [Saprospiraceae bacterium]